MQNIVSPAQRCYGSKLCYGLFPSHHPIVYGFPNHGCKMIILFLIGSTVAYVSHDFRVNNSSSLYIYWVQVHFQMNIFAQSYLGT